MWDDERSEKPRGEDGGGGAADRISALRRAEERGHADREADAAVCPPTLAGEVFGLIRSGGHYFMKRRGRGIISLVGGVGGLWGAKALAYR